MMATPVPGYEAVRLRILQQYQILDTEPEAGFDQLTNLAAQICQTPIAWIGLMDHQRVWFKSKLGWDTAAIPTELSPCHYTMAQRSVLVVPDAQADVRFAYNPLIWGEPYFRFYAGAALVSPEGIPIGTIAVLDWVARALTPEQQLALEHLSHQTIAQLELRRKTLELEAISAQRRQAIAHQDLMFQTSPDLLGMLGFNHHFKRLNRNWQKVLGFTAAELMAHPMLDWIHPEEQETMAAVLQTLQQTVGQQQVETRYRCQDGSYRILSWHLTSPPGEEVIYVTARDITEEHEATIHLQKAFQELNDLQFALNEHSIVAITDRQGVITYANEKFCQVSQYSASELIGETHRIVNSGVHPKEFFAELWATITAGQVWKGEVCNQKKDGNLYWVDSTIVPILDEEGVPYEYIAIRTEITSQKESLVALQERSRLSDLNAQISILLSQGGTVTDLLQDCVEVLVEYLNIPFVRLWTFNPEAKLLELQAIAGQHSHMDDLQSSIPLGISIIGFIAQNKRPYFTNDLLNDLCIGAKEWVEREDLVSFAGYPLIVEDRLMGVIALFSHHPFTEPVLHTLSWITNSVAIAIDRSWAREELLSRREALLFRLASQIRDSLNLDVILNTTVNEIRTLLKIDRCHFVWCWANGDRPDLVITHEARNPNLPTFLGDCPLEQLDTLSKTILNQDMIRVNDVENEGDIRPNVRELLHHGNLMAQLLIPLENQSGQLGAIVCSHTTAHNWLDSEVELLQAVADQVAIAIDQAELYAKTRAAACAAESQAKQLSDTLQDLKQAQAQLIQHEKMSSLGQMVAGIAHEINNPVNFINGNLIHATHYITDLLELTQLYQLHYPEPVPAIQELAEEIDIDFITEDLPKLLGSMKIGADRIRQIVLSLRNFSRLDEAEMKPVDIHEGIDSTLMILHNRLKAGSDGVGIQVVKEYGILPPVECYAGQLNQVFMNVLANAIDALNDQPEPKLITIHTEFIPPEEPTTCEATSGEPSLDDTALYDPKLDQLISPALQGTALIRIRDNGSGMSPDVKARLFDPFFTTKPVGQGTGLGMSISYQIVVQKHGGSLDCVSEPGEGTEFIIKIPSNQSYSARTL